jgi:hypothetical protein
VLPLLRAAADRVWYDDANVLLIASVLPPGGLERRSAVSGWSVRQLIAHLSERQLAIGVSVERFLAGLEQSTGGFARCEPPPAGTESLDELLGALRTSRNRLFAVLEQVKFAKGQLPLGGAPAVDTVFAWAQHAAGHALDFTDALPELHDNPMVLNWLFWPVYPEGSELAKRQLTLFDAVKDRLVAHTEEGSNRKRNLAKRLVKKR